MDTIILPKNETAIFKFVQIYSGNKPFLCGKLRESHADLLEFMLENLNLDFQRDRDNFPLVKGENYEAVGMGLARKVGQNVTITRTSSGIYGISYDRKHLEICQSLCDLTFKYE